VSGVQTCALPISPGSSSTFSVVFPETRRLAASQVAAAKISA
jgi:hypothetical protein